MIDSIEKYLAELIGTFILVFVAVGSIGLNNATNESIGTFGIAALTGLAVATVIYIFGNISGAHINPAVTISLFVARQIDFQRSLSYITSQLTGGVAACLLLWNIFPMVVSGNNIGATSLSSEISFTVGIVIEAILTFFLVFTIFGLLVDNKSSIKYENIAVGIIVFLNIIIGASLTGASMNPARTFGPAIFIGYWTDHLVYWIGPCAGGIIAAVLYTKLFTLKALGNA